MEQKPQEKNFRCYCDYLKALIAFEQVKIIVLVEDKRKAEEINRKLRENYRDLE